MKLFFIIAMIDNQEGISDNIFATRMGGPHVLKSIRSSSVRSNLLRKKHHSPMIRVEDS